MPIDKKDNDAYIVEFVELVVVHFNLLIRLLLVYHAPSLRCCRALCGVNVKLPSIVVVWALWPHDTLRMSGYVDAAGCATRACESKLHVYTVNTKVIACLDVYQLEIQRLYYTCRVYNFFKEQIWNCSQFRKTAINIQFFIYIASLGTYKGLIPRRAKCETFRAKTHLCENLLSYSDFHSREKIRQNTSIWLASLFCHPKHKHLIGFAISIAQRSRNEFNYPAKRNISQRNTCCACVQPFRTKFFAVRSSWN
jgi:hypothetical protein